MVHHKPEHAGKLMGMQQTIGNARAPVLHKDCDVCESPKNRWTRSGVPCRIINRSKVPLKFEWKDHGTAEEDERSAAGPGAGSRGP